MKKQILLLSLITSVLTSQAQNFSKFEDKSGKVGFKSQNGTVVIKPIYGAAWDKFTEGLVGVYQNKKWGYIDSTGKTVIPFKYSEVSEFLPDVKLARVFMGEKMGYVNNVGKEVIPAIYDELGHAFYNDVVSGALKNKCGAIDKTGKIVVPFVYNEWLNFNRGLFITSLNKKFGIINKANEKILPFIYDTIEFVFNSKDISRENIFIVKLDKKFAVLDNTAKIIIPFMYDEIVPKGDLFRTKRIGEKKYGLYDKLGKRIEFEIYDEAGYIGNDTYYLGLDGRIVKYVDKEGKEVDRKGNRIEE